MSLTLADLYASPDHYLQSFEGEDAMFVPMDRAAYARSIFLDARISPAREGVLRVPVAALGQPPAAARVGWIFHVAHCGSTLLARALEELGGGLVLKEPLALRQLAFAPDPHRLDLLLAMLGKSYGGTAPNVVKANVPVNFMLGEIAARQSQAPVVLLYWNLPQYLTAILRSENHRAWLRNLTGQLSAHLGALEGASDAERAAALWLAQVSRFDVMVSAMPEARTLDAASFFAHPGEAITAAAGLFEIGYDAAALAALLSGPLFSTYSKRPEIAFDNADRLAREAENSAAFAPELVEAEHWLAVNGPDAGELTTRLAAAALFA